MTILLMCALAALLVGSPFAAAALGQPLGAVPAALLTASGILVFMLAGVLIVFTRLYQKTKASEAFVRTGAGGVRVIRDGGAIIVPILHELVRVSLQTLKLEVTREDEEALITEDKLRADIRAEFFVRVQPDRDSILQAARSLGDTTHPQTVKALVEDKLVSALRTAAAGKTLEQLNAERDAFLAEVMKLVTDDLRANGLVLETVTISKLDQTDEQFLKAENIFDAQGRRKIAEITQLNLTERNRLVREGEQARKGQDVTTQQQLLELERREREARAVQAAEVAKIETEAARAAQERRIDAARQIELAEVEKRRALEVATRIQEQASEVAEREKQESVALAEKKRAAAERELAEAEAERERARQLVETVRVTQEAERQKRKQVIDAEALAEQMFVGEQRRADAEAYGRQRQAEAQRLAADAEAEAIRKRAEAESEAERLLAEGTKAKAMVPVEVARAEVATERERIESVVKAELEARERHGKVAQEYEIARLRVEAEREVRIAFANAQASLFTKMQANLYGTPEDVMRMSSSLLSGQRVAAAIGGFLQSADPRAVEALGGLAGSVGEIANAVAQRIGGNGIAHEPPAEPAPEEALDLAGE
jgi:flotillin